MADHSYHEPPRFWRSRAGVVLLVFLAIAGFLLLFEHRAHIPGDYWLVGGLLLVCILMHGFMHGGHSRGDKNVPRDERSADRE